MNAIIIITDLVYIASHSSVWCCTAPAATLVGHLVLRGKVRRAGADLGITWFERASERARRKSSMFLSIERRNKFTMNLCWLLGDSLLYCCIYKNKNVQNDGNFCFFFVFWGLFFSHANVLIHFSMYRMIVLLVWSYFWKPIDAL
jgi:hypothetical protein